MQSSFDLCLYHPALCEKKRVKTVSDVLEKTLQAIEFILNETGNPQTHPSSPSLSFSVFFSFFVAPSLISELRAEKIEQKSITLVWREPSYPNSSRTEYEVKYYEKVKSIVIS